MRIQRLDGGGITISEIEEPLGPILLEILPSADPQGNVEVQDRLFASPTAGADPEADEEWREYVTPDLQTHLQEHLDVVARDLLQLRSAVEEELPSLRISADHLESWISALTQARLAMHARHHLDEDELERAPTLSAERRRLAFQMEFYGLLLETMVREMQWDFQGEEDSFEGEEESEDDSDSDDEVDPGEKDDPAEEGQP